ncbi:MAG: hypothetical protein KKH79_09205, partial [Candidatus Thermoplasmatota archaeon]|nr:hypothetical protein [Candidatus Thermoplasmatota archaeon]
PSEIYKLDNITKYNIKRDLFGIHHSIKMIEEGVIKYCIWEPSESSDILKVKVHSEDVSSINDKDRYAFL